MANARVLVVDDEPDIRQTVRDILEDEGYVVDTAESAAAAREARRLQRPDLVLLDIWMPDLDGISLLREWSERGGLPCPGDHDQRARHGRDGRRGDAAGRVGFHRKTHFARQTAAGDFARARSEPAQARERRPAPPAARADRSRRHRARHAGAARAGRAPRRARHLGADPRRARHRQGNTRARAARAQRATQRPVRDRRRRRDRARACGADAVRRRGRRPACSRA